jgi:hypothetical protein
MTVTLSDWVLHPQGSTGRTSETPGSNGALAQPPFEANAIAIAIAIAHDQHADHHFRIDRRTRNRAIEIGEVVAQVAQIEAPINAAQQMICWDVIFKIERVKQPRLATRLLSYHAAFSRVCRWSGGALRLGFSGARLKFAAGSLMHLRQLLLQSFGTGVLCCYRLPRLTELALDRLHSLL